MKKKWLIIGISVIVLITLGALLYFCFLKPHWQKVEHNKAVTQYREAKYEKYRQENEAYDDYEVEVAFLGDSLTDGYDLQKILSPVHHC